MRFEKLERSLAFILSALGSNGSFLSKGIAWCVFKRPNKAIEISDWYY